MNRYPRHLAEIDLATRHLSPAEFGCYGRLLDHYFATERALPADPVQLTRISGATDAADRCAVARVVAEFFELGADGLLHHAGADREIAQAARSSGNYARFRSLIFERDGGACVYCGATGDGLELDHVLPRSRGGSDLPDNLALACQTCNRSKGARTPEEWGRA